MEDDDARHSVRTVHEAGRPLEYLYRVYRVRVCLHAVLVAPLLAFLPDAVVDHHHAVVAQSAYHRFGDAAAGGNLRHAGLAGYGVDDVGGGLHGQLAGRDEGYGSRRLAEPLAAGKPGHHHLAELHGGLGQGQMACSVLRLVYSHSRGCGRRAQGGQPYRCLYCVHFVSTYYVYRRPLRHGAGMPVVPRRCCGGHHL